MSNLTTFQAQWMTLFFVLAVTFLVIVYDLLVIQTHGVDASISRVLRDCFEHYPILYPVFWLWIGVLIGHIGLPCQ